MNRNLLVLAYALMPLTIFCQNKHDSTQAAKLIPDSAVPGKQLVSSTSYIFMTNISTVFYTAHDQRIDKFLKKYGYAAPQNIPVGIRLELSAIPAGGKMMYSLAAGTIVSKQDISSADFSLGLYRRFIQIKNIWALGGLSLGEHFDRIALNGSLPPAFDSLYNTYQSTLTLHRIGFAVDPSVKTFWFPWQRKNLQIGIFVGTSYDMDFNGKWRLGYYPHAGSGFKNLGKPTNVATYHEFGWAFSTGLSVCI